MSSCASGAGLGGGRWEWASSSKGSCSPVLTVCAVWLHWLRSARSPELPKKLVARTFVKNLTFLGASVSREKEEQHEGVWGFLRRGVPCGCPTLSVWELEILTIGHEAANPSGR